MKLLWVRIGVLRVVVALCGVATWIGARSDERLRELEARL